MEQQSTTTLTFAMAQIVLWMTRKHGSMIVRVRFTAPQRGRAQKTGDGLATLEEHCSA
ncbi:MAG TPA: hypothetical protein VKC66_25125 [Xanthobacteraceae bacterium]|nr:hypothetical protein [Xanthobacteraceae bacterium]